MWTPASPTSRRWPAAGCSGPAERPPILCLTSCDHLDRIVPELGFRVEDYVTKPCRITEVLARSEVLLRDRQGGRRDSTHSHGDLRLDDAACRAWRGARPLDLTPAEYRLLRYLLVNAEQVLSKEQLARHLWGESRGDNAIERLVSRLRNPEQLALLRDTDDPKVVAGAVEELLRYLTIVHTGIRRIAVADIEFGGQVIRAGGPTSTT